MVKHRGFREVVDLAAGVNDAALGLLVSGQLARFTLGNLDDKAAERKLSDLYPESAVADVSRFDFRAARAITKLKDAEQELCVMAVPFAISLYNEYLVSASDLLELAHVARPSKPAEQQMLGQLTGHLKKNGVRVDGEWASLLQLIIAIRNRIVHAAAVPGKGPIAEWSGLQPQARTAWIGVTGRDMPFAGPENRLPWAGPEIRGVFLVVREALRQINLCLQDVLPRDFWADLAVHEMRSTGHQKARRSRSGGDLVKFANMIGYGPLSLSPAELRDAAAKAPTTGWTPTLKPYWQRQIEHGTPSTQMLTRRDVRKGRIRIPDASKHLLPSDQGDVRVKIREVSLTCGYNPEPERGRIRSGVLYVGPHLAELAVPGQRLFIFRLPPSGIGLQ